jgi:hypothetical protein
MNMHDEHERELVMMHKKREHFMRVLSLIKNNTHARVDIDMMIVAIDAFSLLYELVIEYDELDDDARENVDDIFNECIMRAREL